MAKSKSIEKAKKSTHAKRNQIFRKKILENSNSSNKINKISNEKVEKISPQKQESSSQLWDRIMVK